MDVVSNSSISCIHSLSRNVVCVEDDDFVSVSELLEWHQDSPSLTQCVSVPIINDKCVEEKEEYFTVTLSTEEECVDFGDASEATVIILDDDGAYSSYSYMHVAIAGARMI